MKKIELIKGLTELTLQEKNNIAGGDRFMNDLGNLFGSASAFVANCWDSLVSLAPLYAQTMQSAR